MLFVKYRREHIKSIKLMMFIRNKKSITTFERYLEHYGNNTIAESTINRLKLQPKITSISKESVKFFNKLKTYCEISLSVLGDIIFGDKEYRLVGSDCFRYCDFIIPSLGIMIEYSGTSFHSNKDKLSLVEWSVWVSVRGNNNAKNSYQRQSEKINLDKENGFDVLEIWNGNRFEINFNLCVEFIKNKINKNG